MIRRGQIFCRANQEESSPERWAFFVSGIIGKDVSLDLRTNLLGLSFALIWSSAFTSARIIVKYAPPLTALCLRFLISGLIGVAIARVLGQSWRLTKDQWRVVIFFGICQNSIYLGLNFVALQQIEASLAAIIASSMPLLVALASRVLFKERLAPLGTIGLIAGVVGVAIIMGSRLTSGAPFQAVAVCAMAVLSLTAATMMVRGIRFQGNALMIVGLQMLAGSAALAVPAFALESWDVTWSGRFLLAFSYTLIFPGLVATLTWFALINRVGPVRASVFHFLTPFLGISIAAILLREPLRLVDLVGVGIVTLGILAVQISKPRQPE